MRSRLFRPAFHLAFGTALGLFGLTGCQAFLDSRQQHNLPSDTGTVSLQGLATGASIRRNAQGMPLIESSSFHDTLFALGYVHASDRLSQMIGMRLLAEGRLAEMAGPDALDMDRLLRTVNLRRSADQLYQSASPRLKKIFAVYARGVNAYLFRYRDHLPADLTESGYKPAYWTAQDSVLLFCLLNFGMTVNLQEEIAALVLAQKVGADTLAWLTPTYPDEPLPFEEAAKLSAIRGPIQGLSALHAATRQLPKRGVLGGTPASNWAIAPALSRSGKSLLANAIDGPQAQSSLWHFVQIRSPKYSLAGVSIAGVPMLHAGFNGKLAWAMSAVPGDSQDVFVEQIKTAGDGLLYLADGKWLPARKRQETFFIKGQRPIRERVFETRHGPLLNSVLGERAHPLQPLQIASGYGLALQSAALDGAALDSEQSLDGFFALSRAQSVEQAFEATRTISAMALNLVFADAEQIGWQMTGRFPNRRAGIGLLPSPGWDGQYDWDGFADPMLYPYDQDPAQGWLGTAQQRTVDRGYGMQLSNSWQAPERAERIGELAGRGKHDTPSMLAMQSDRKSLLVGKLQSMLSAPGMQQPLQQAMDALPAASRGNARQALRRLLAFDGRLNATSGEAALYAAFLDESARQTFLDELGPQGSPAWNALEDSATLSYSAQVDHLLGRDDSPFWNDVGSAQQEDKPTILARSLAAAVTLAESRQGRASQTDNWAETLDNGVLASMRIVVDFGRAEPMRVLSRIGQSDHPVSQHATDAGHTGHYLSVPFQSQNLEQIYGGTRLRILPAK
jgi:acyl-homoserine-lactone acylase